MPIKLKQMTSDQWKALKASAEIKSTPWYKKGHADVGSKIAKLNTARAKWKGDLPTQRDLLDYYNALEKLETSLKKFLKAKEFKATPEAQALCNEIQGWLTEIEAKKTKLSQITNDQTRMDELARNDAKVATAFKGLDW